ncbi:tail fiber protein [Corallococcus interemptor]|uniref:Tail fiber protein n=1 Tax=Corallococcus interemptor TaxID=2316720 RepID=A0A3A8R242_9BACT|nr:phage tail protein [Corallococcus interemptor]RKH53858.1 tail fiber protein [Corallococcus sp. AB050B]RKH71222.1 tail fiber protein [Corallococcus interemptor]
MTDVKPNKPTIAADAIPVGAVLAYGGDPSKLAPQGWLLCDGSGHDVAELPELFKAIGTANGGYPGQSFNLPNFQGYFLRGTAGATVRDPDVKTRTAAQKGGNVEDRPGSVESWATSFVGQSFQGEADHLPHRLHRAYEDFSEKLAHWEDGTLTWSGFVTGGDKESRPVNAYVHFIIKASSTDSRNNPTAIPTGAILPFAGRVLTDTRFLSCNGNSHLAASQPELFAVLGKSFGGNGNPYFYVPDFRGRFLRGVSGSTGNDPDATTRTAPQPTLPSGECGSVGNLVGSVQDWATGAPRNPISLTFHHLPTGSKKATNIRGQHVCKYTSKTTNVKLKGGNLETRPGNVNVDWYVCGGPASSTATSDGFPIGAVVGFPGEARPPSEYWAPCDGAGQATTDAYAPLFAQIGYANGGSGNVFYLPDYRGRFLRGTDHGAGRDPDAAQRLPPLEAAGGNFGDAVGSVQEFATGAPRTSAFSIEVKNLPKDDSNTADTVKGGFRVGEWNKGSKDVDATSGDKETRPININVNYYIKYASAP